MTRVGDVASTTAPLPVDVVPPVPPLATARVPPRVIVPEPVIGPPEVVSPVVPPDMPTLVTVPPLPEGVDQVPSPRRYVALDGVPVAFMPPTGNPVALVSVALDGVPRLGVTSVGLVASTTAPEPVDVVAPVPPFATASVPVIDPANAKFKDPKAGAVKPPTLSNGCPAEPTDVTPGELPAPPPYTTPYCVNAPDEAHVDALLKYGMPPLVPATVNDGVVVGLATEIRPPVNPTLVTVPVAVPVGVAHVPSPRQNVLDDADVPLLRFVTGRLPVTPVVSGNPVALVSVPDDGVPSAPPLTTNAPLDPVFTPSAVATPVPVVMPWMVLELVHCASWPDVGVPELETLPPPAVTFKIPDDMDSPLPSVKPLIVLPVAA